MGIKVASWMGPLVVAFTIVWGGPCFAQSGSANVPAKETAEAEQTNSVQLVAAAALPNPVVRTEAQPENTAPNDAESSGSQFPRAAGREGSYAPFSRVGIGVKISTLGAGIEAATPLARKFNLRGGFNMLRYSRPLAKDGIQYQGDLRFQSAEAHLDYYLLGGLHISPGVLLYNGNEITATAAVAGGQTFSVGGTTYESDAADPVNGTGKLDFVKVSPSIMLGIGNLVPRNGRRFSFLFEVGGAYQGSARVALNLTGSVCDTTGLNCRSISTDPTVQANVQSEQVKIQNDVNPYRFYPILSVGFGFNF